MLSVDAVRNHVTGIRLSTVPMCSESGNLPVTELVYTIKWFTSLGADWDAARVYTGCCTAWQISDRELPPRSIYDILTQIWFSMVIYHIQCRQTFVVASQRVRCRHGVTHLSRRTKATSASDRRPSVSLSSLQCWKADPIFTRVLLLDLSFRRHFPCECVWYKLQNYLKVSN